MAMGGGGKKGGAMSEINVTPMADIMIVLLIIFMVVTPLIQKGVSVTLPTAANTKERKDEPKTVTVAITKDLRTYLNAKPYDNPTEFATQMKEKVDELPEGGKIVYLKADTGLPYSEVMKIMDVCREAGAEELALIAEKKV
jgi:biopolymer transport protein ExbD